MKTLYHVTATENVESIVRHGLRASAGHGKIFGITTKRRWYELGLPCFSVPNGSALFAIDPKGIDGVVRRDRYYCEIYQTVIEPEYLTLLWRECDSYYLRRAR